MKLLVEVKNIRLFRFLSAAYIVSFATMLYFASVDKISLLMLSMMFLSPIFIASFFLYFQNDELPVYGLMGCILVGSFYHFSSFRLSTVAYAFFFLMTFIAFKRILDTGCYDKKSYLNLVKQLIYAYFFVLVIQQMLTIVRLPVFNQCWQFSNPFKLNSLAHEPSYIGGTLLILFYSYKKIYESFFPYEMTLGQFYNENKKLCHSYIYVCLTCLSTWALFGALVMGLYLFRKNKQVLVVLALACLMLPFLSSDLESVDRLVKIIPAILTFDTNLIKSVDLSAAARINPVLYYIQDFNPLSVDTWFGLGIDYSKTHTIVRLLDTDMYMEQGNATGGLFPAFFWDYGLLAGFFFLCSLKKFAVKRFVSFPFVVWLLFFLPIGFNTYMTWQFFMIMYATNYYLNHSRENQLKPLWGMTRA